MTARPASPTLRWSAEITYRTDAGPIDVLHTLEELEDLHDVVESGPHWDTIICIKIHRYRPYIPELTVEAAERL